MRLPILARARYRTIGMLATAGLLSACAGESTAPITDTQRDADMAAPTGASRALIGTSNGVYTFTVNPTRVQTLGMGWSSLTIPANAICRLSDSGYGVQYWNQACAPQTVPLTITATITGAQTLNPRIDFQPALRFDPAKMVKLQMFVDTRSKLLTNWNILYCATDVRAECVDESLTDPTLKASVRGHMVTRRIKHFSGYVVTNIAEDAGNLLGF